MVDLLDKPVKWNRTFQTYVEKHNLYDVFQELLKEMIINKPKDPLVYVKENITRIGRGVYNPRTFVVGPQNAYTMAKNLANSVGAIFLTLDQVILEIAPQIRQQLGVFLMGIDTGDDAARKLLVTYIIRRLEAKDCDSKGYVLYGFPQSKAQATWAQKMGLLPRQVFVMLPDPQQKQKSSEESSSSTPEENENNQDELDEIPGEDYRDSMSRPVNYLKAMMKPNMTMESYQLLLKDISSAYHDDICKVISAEKYATLSPAELEAEMMGTLLTWKPLGGPFVPRVVVIGPPASGKSLIADHLCSKLGCINVDWSELLRGAERWEDKVAAEAKAHLESLAPMSDDSVKAIITRRLQKPDCDRKGWVLQGFPQNKNHCKLLETLSLSPNRIFLLSCSRNLSNSRMEKKKDEVLSRRLAGVPIVVIDEKKVDFPYGPAAVEKRYEAFAQNLEGILAFYGTKVIFVDSEMKAMDVRNFVESSIQRPPALPKGS